MDFPGESPLEDIFSDLSADDYQETSDYSPSYNCIAWAAGSTTEWWWPAPGYYWPSGAPRVPTVASAVTAFGILGYVPCTSADLENGIEKVAIYGRGNTLTHAARQLDDGRWTSKIGKRIDIAHATLQCLDGIDYGTTACFLQRKRNADAA